MFSSLSTMHTPAGYAKKKRSAALFALFFMAFALSFGFVGSITTPVVAEARGNNGDDSSSNVGDSGLSSDGSTVVDAGSNAAQSIYNDIVKLSTPVAAASAVIAFLVSMFSHNQKVIDQSRGVVKSVLIAWVVINGLGFVLNWLAPMIQGGGVDFSGVGE